MTLVAVSRFRELSLMPSEDVDVLEQAYPGYLAGRLEKAEAWIHARLVKRYVTPFSTVSPPLIVVGWIVDIVTLDAYLRRGFNPTSAQDALIEKQAETARAEVLEAADSESGLFELPLRQDAPSTSGATLGGPFGYSESSPYVWTTRQARQARQEDADGEGTS